MSDPWLQGDGYEPYVGRWSRRVAPEFVDWLAIPPGRRWMDVGCGTGALTSTILERCAPASVVGVEPSDGFRSWAVEHVLDPRARFVRGDATNLPPEEVDVVVAGLVLNFVPDRLAALGAMRTVAPGGVIAAYVWDYAEGMQLMRHFWNAVVALDPSAHDHDEAVRSPVCKPDRLTELWQEAGLDDVVTRSIDIPTVFRDFDDYWSPFLAGQGPGPAYAMSLDPDARDRLRDRIREHLPIEPDGSIHLVARAWAVRGQVSD